jgi:uncharacterized protein with FMN-binding domain
MKRVGIALLVLVGAGGLIALLMYHPKAMEATVATVTTKSPSPSASAAAASAAASDPPNPAAGSAAKSSSSTSGSAASGAYKNGTYTGSATETAYGIVQVQAVVSGGKITGVNFLQMPNSEQHSVQVTAMAKPLLLQETLQAQVAQVNTVSGATQTSEGFVQSLESALNQAKA